MPALFTFSGCDPCPVRKDWQWLKNPRMPFTPPTESTDYRVFVLGEAPGSEEDQFGKQFIGPAGRYLRDRVPTEWKNKLYFQNVIRCRPDRNHTPTEQEIQCCSVFLEQDFLNVRPHVILGLGNIPHEYFWQCKGEPPTISKIRGLPYPVRLEDGTPTWFFPCFHPSYPLRADKKNDSNEIINTVEPVFRNDLINFFNLVKTKFATPPTIYSPPTNILYPKTYDEAYALFLRLKEPYAIDFETFKLRPYIRDGRLLTAALSDGELTFAFPVQWPGDINPWGLELLKTIANTKKRWIAQNATMELNWIRWLTGVQEQEFDDTELVARLLHRRTGAGKLELLARLYLGFDLKGMFILDKDRMNEYPLDQVLKYNAHDAWGTAIIYQIMMAQMIERPDDCANYERSLVSIASTIQMEIMGLPPDISASEEFQKDLFAQQQDLEKQAKQIKEVKEYEKKESTYFSISSPQNVARVLTLYCGFNLPFNEKTKYYSTDEEYLTPLLGQHPLIDITLEYREVSKQLSTYVTAFLDGTIIGIDGLVHPRYKVTHTATWRLSSEVPNIQNFPKRKNRHIRRQIIPPPGHVLAAFDYGGLELRGIQMACHDKNLARAVTDPRGYLNDADLHWFWLHKALEYYPPYINRLADVSGETEEKKILKGGRTIIKTDFVFASFYGSTAKAVANRTQIPVHIIEELHHELWTMFPDAEKWTRGQFDFYQKYGYIESLTGRIRNEVLPGHELTNNPIQGTGAEIVLEAQSALYKMALELREPYLFPRINIHDDLTFILPDTNELERYIIVISKEMTKPRFPFISVPLLVECSVGGDWANMQEVAQFEGKSWDEEMKLAYA